MTAPSGTEVFPRSGEMARLCRAHDWASTPLGPVAGWPQGLRTAAAMVLGSPFPALLLWGEDLVQIHNDRYLALLGAGHAGALGRPAREAWAGAWDTAEPLLKRALAGEHVELRAAAAGAAGQPRADLAFSPVPGEAGGVGGVLVTVDAGDARYRMLFEANPQPMWVFDVETLRFLAANDAAVHQYGYTRAEMLGMTIRDIRPAEDVPLLLADLSQPLDGFEGASLWRHRRKDGSLLWVDISAHTLDFEGRPAELVLAIDVTERVEAKRRSAESERRLALALEGARQGLWDWTIATGACHVGPELERLLGYEPGTLAPRIDALRDLVHPDDLGGALAAVEAALAAGAGEYSVECRLRRGDGGWLWVQDRGTVVERTADGRPARPVGVVQDIGARRAVEAEREQLLEAEQEARRQVEEQTVELESAIEALQEASETIRDSEARFRALIEHAADAVTVLDRAGRVLYHSPSSTRVDGALRGAVAAGPGSEPVAIDLAAWAHPDDMPAVRAALARAAREPASPVLLEVRRRDGAGGWRVIEATITDLSHEPAVRGIVINSHDVTERRALEAQLAQSQRMEVVGRLAGGIAHDFNNLLTVIRGNAQLALPDVDAAVRPTVEEIDRAAERAADLTRQLLAFSRRQVLRPKVVDLNAALDEMSRMLQRLIGEDVTLHLDLADPLWPVRVDPGQLQQVVMNLAVNARDAMPRGGSLRLRTRNRTTSAATAAGELAALPPGDYVELEVHDDGSGMSDAVRARAFEPFFTTKETGKGTGLGLSTVYGIVTQSEGAVWVESEPGSGTTFHVLLPRAAGRPARAAAPAPALRDLPGGSETVLVVEDEDSVRGVVATALESRGYRVLRAAGGAEAIELCEAHDGPIDLLLTDVVMPGISGTVLQQRLAALRPGLRVLFMSGYTADAVDQHGIRTAGTAFLQKPFTPETLLTRVRECIDGDDDALIG